MSCANATNVNVSQSVSPFNSKLAHPLIWKTLAPRHRLSSTPSSRPNARLLAADCCLLALHAIPHGHSHACQVGEYVNHV